MRTRSGKSAPRSAPRRTMPSLPRKPSHHKDTLGANVRRPHAQAEIRSGTHVVLLAHEGCGYYRSRNPGVESEDIIQKQLSDPRNAAFPRITAFLRITARWFCGAML